MYVWNGEVFYVAIYCEANCSYNLIANLVSELELKPNTITKVILQGNRENIFKYTHNDTSINSLDIFAFSHTMAEFKMYVTLSIYYYLFKILNSCRHFKFNG